MPAITMGMTPTQPFLRQKGPPPGYAVLTALPATGEMRVELHGLAAGGGRAVLKARLN